MKMEEKPEKNRRQEVIRNILHDFFLLVFTNYNNCSITHLLWFQIGKGNWVSYQRGQDSREYYNNCFFKRTKLNQLKLIREKHVKTF